MQKGSYLDHCKNLILATEEAKEPHADAWQRNIAFFKGFHHSGWHPVYGLHPKLKHESWRVRLAVNFVRTVALTLSAKLTQNRPQWTVLPATKDDDDRDRARLCQMCLDYVWEQQRLQPKLYKAALWSVLTGQGYWAIYWNQNAGQQVGMDGKQKIFTGFPQIDVPAPFDIGIDPLAETIKDAEFGYRIRLVSIDWVKKMYEKTVKGDDLGNSEVSGEVFSRMQMSSILQSAQYGEALKRNYVKVVEFYDTAEEKYTIFLPKQKIVLAKGEWNGPIPYVQCRNIPNTGDIELGGKVGSHQSLGETTLSDVIQLQRVLNRSVSQLVEISNMLAFPRILAKKGTIDRSTLIDMPGSVVEYSGPTPTPFHLGNVPEWRFRMPDQLIGFMRNVSGIHEISYGASVGNIQSGRGLAIMAEQDATKFGPVARSLGYMVQEAGSKILEFWRKYSDAPTTLNVVGRNSELEVTEFFASDISSTDVWVQPGSTFAVSKAMRQDQILQAWLSGLEKDDRKIKRALEFGELDAVYGDVNVHKLKQRREIADMINGGPVPQVQQWEDSQTHLEVLTEFMNGTTYEQLDEFTQKKLQQHYQMHYQQYQQDMMGQQQAADQRGQQAAGQLGTLMAGPGGQMDPATQQSQLPSQDTPDRMAESFPAMGAGKVTGGMR